MESIEQIALEMNRERKFCPTCLNTKVKGRGPSKHGKASDALASSLPCDHCFGRGYLWFTKLLDPSMPHALDSGITTERMVEMWKKKHISN